MIENKSHPYTQECITSWILLFHREQEELISLGSIVFGYYKTLA